MGLWEPLELILGLLEVILRLLAPGDYFRSPGTSWDPFWASWVYMSWFRLPWDVLDLFVGLPGTSKNLESSLAYVAQQ